MAAQFGISGIDVPSGQSAAKMAAQIKSLGATHVRPVIRWDSIQPREGVWNWTAWDAFFALLRQNGGRAWVVLHTGSAAWATDHGYTRPNTTPTTNYPPLDMVEWAAFVEEVVNRCKGDVDVWLLGNEMSEGYSYAGDADAYLWESQAAIETIRGAAPEAKVVLGAIPAGVVQMMMQTDNGAVLSTQNQYRVDFYRQELSLLPACDGAAANVGAPYILAAYAKDTVAAYGKQMEAHGGGVKPLWITEANPEITNSTTAGQTFCAWAKAILATGKVSGLAWLQYADSAAYPNIGLVTPTLAVKPAWTAYQTLLRQYYPVTPKKKRRT